jgi:hypothetical protein
MRGDFNFDEEINEDDIQAMLRALADVTQYQDEWGLGPSDLLAVGDVNNDGSVNNRDIQAELNLIASLEGAGSLSAVPEPATWVLLAMALPALCFRKLARR